MLAQRVVRSDRRVVDAERREQQRDQHARAILPACAEQQRGIASRVTQQLERGDDRLPARMQHVDVPGGQVLRRDRVVGEAGHVPSFGDHRQVDDASGDELDRKPAVALELAGRAQVEHRAQLERADHGSVRAVESMQPGTAQQSPPRQGHASGRTVATEVAHVERALELDVACGHPPSLPIGW